MSKFKGLARYGCTIYGVTTSIGLFCLGVMALLLVRVRHGTKGGGSDIQPTQKPSRHPALDAAVMRKLASVLDPEIMQNVPASPDAFIKGMRNPCWDHEGSVRCLPYFVSPCVMLPGGADACMRECAQALDEPSCPACAQYLAGSFQAGVDTLFRQLTQVGVQG